MSSPLSRTVFVIETAIWRINTLIVNFLIIIIIIINPILIDSQNGNQIFGRLVTFKSGHWLSPSEDSVRTDREPLREWSKNDVQWSANGPHSHQSLDLTWFDCSGKQQSVFTTHQIIWGLGTTELPVRSAGTVLEISMNWNPNKLQFNSLATNSLTLCLWSAPFGTGFLTPNRHLIRSQTYPTRIVEYSRVKPSIADCGVCSIRLRRRLRKLPFYDVVLDNCLFCSYLPLFNHHLSGFDCVDCLPDLCLCLCRTGGVRWLCSEPFFRH